MKRSGQTDSTGRGNAAGVSAGVSSVPRSCSGNEPGVVADGLPVRRMNWRSHPDEGFNRTHESCAVRSRSTLSPLGEEGSPREAVLPGSGYEEEHLLEAIFDAAKVSQAWKRVRRNRGAPGIDGMIPPTIRYSSGVEELRETPSILDATIFPPRLLKMYET